MPPSGIVVGVVGIHDRVHHARLCRAAEAMDARDALPVGILHALIVMMAPINLTRYVMRVVVRVMLWRTAMYSLLPFSSRNRSGIYQMMSRTKLKWIGWRVGVRLLAIQQRNHVG